MADLTEAEALDRIVLRSAVRFDARATGQIAVVPEGFKIENLERFQNRPNRIEAHHRFADAKSLAAYVSAFQQPWTRITASYAPPGIFVVLDGSAPDEPSFETHKASLEPDFSLQFAAWHVLGENSLSQGGFGEFLEERAVDVIHPDAASVMGMVMAFDAMRKVTFKSALRLSDGTRQFQYSEEDETRGGVTFPDRFVLRIPVFEHGDP